MQSILLFILIFGSHIQSTIGNINFSLVDIFIPVFLVYLWIKNRKIYMKLLGVFLCFFIIQCLSVLLSDIPINYYNFREIGKTYIWYIYFIIGYNLIKTECVLYADILKSIKNVAYIFFSLSYLFYFFHLISHIPNLVVNYPPRFNGFLKDPNLFAGLCIFYIIFSISQKDVILLTMSSIGLLLSASRTGFFSLIIILLLYICFLNYNKKQIKTFNFISIKAFGTAVLVLFLILVILYIAVPDSFIYFQQVATRIIGQDSLFDHSMLDRLSKWGVAFSVFQDNPVFGIGRGNYFVYSEIVTGSVFRAHNSYLQIMAENGVVGLIAFALLLIIPVAFLFKRNQWNVISYYFGVLAFWIIGLGINFENFRFYWILCGFIYGVANKRF